MILERRLLFFIIIYLCLYAFSPLAYAAYGWLPTDNAIPFYYQPIGHWYQNEDTKTFMVQLDERTYKYIFTLDGKFLSGWVTDMPIRLP